MLPFATTGVSGQFAGANVKINYPVELIPIIKLPTAENGIIFNEVIIAHAALKSGPARDVNLFPSEEKVVEEAALVLS